jgi:peroxiredoxin-like protein
MQPLPHHYNVSIRAGEEGSVEITSPGLSTIVSAPPPEFGGPGDLWSPETLMVAAVADCFVFTFRAIAAASRLRWTNLYCGGEGTVDKADGVVRFTAIRLRARLVLPSSADEEKARKLIEKAEKACLVGNSPKAQPTVEAVIICEDGVLAPTA